MNTPVDPMDEVAEGAATPPLIEEVSSLPNTGTGGDTQSRVIDWLLAIALVMLGGTLLLTGRLLSRRA